MKKYLILLLPFSLFACAGDNNSSGATDSGNVVPTVLEGTWQLPCSFDAVSGDAKLDTNIMHGNTVTIITKLYFGKNDCSGSHDNEVNLTASFSIGDQISTSSGAANKVNAVIQSATVTATTATAVNDFNSVMLCGFNDWSLNVAKDVIGVAGCNFQNANEILFPANDTIYDIFAISNNGMNLNFGDTSDGIHNTNSDATRPIELNLQETWIKQ